MSEYALTWDEIGERLYETGVKMGVLYSTKEDTETGKIIYTDGVAWNGLTKVSEKPTGGEATDLYADDTKYLSLLSLEKFEASMEAYMYPPEFEKCDGSAELTPGVSIGQQSRETFGLSYRTTLGNDVKGNDYGYKLHLIYGCKAQPSEKGYETINDSPAAITFSWEIKTTPVAVKGFKNTASLTIDSTKVDAEKLAALETVLYGTPAGEGTEAVAARLPLPDEVKSILEGNTNP